MPIHLTNAEYQRLTGSKPPTRPPRRPAPPSRVATGDQPERVTFEIDLPPRACSPNEESHRHWSYRSKARADYKADIGWKIKEEGIPTFTAPVTISLVFYVGGRTSDKLYRPRDEQNASGAGKAVVDALVEMGVIQDDRKEFVTSFHASIVPREQEPNRAGVVVTIERL